MSERWPSALRWRLTIWYTALLALPLAALASGTYALVSRTLNDRADAFISDALSAWVREAGAERRAAAGVEAALRSTVQEVRFRDLQIAVADSAGRQIAATPIETPLAPPFRRLGRPLMAGGKRFTVSGTYSLADIVEVRSRLRAAFELVIPLLILVAATGGYLLAGRSLAPAEAAFDLQRRFMADASHELRTPTAILRTEADVTLSKEHRAEEEYRASLDIIRDASRRLTRIVDDLFLLARADAGNLTARREPLYLDELVHETARSTRPLAAQRGVRITVAEAAEAPFEGDADLLGRLVLNLLDNAIRYSPTGEHVDVSLAAHNGVYTIEVADRGEGIPPEAQPRVFDRFFRVDVARSRNAQSSTSGAGLGLAIARRIAELHGGRLDLVESRPGYTRFRASLPRRLAQADKDRS